MTTISGAERIRWMQGCLQRLVEPTLVVDGVAGGRTTAALKQFQRQQGLTADGIAGPRTIAALEAASAAAEPTLHTMAVAREDGEAEEADDGDEEASEASEAAPVATFAAAKGAGYVERRVKVRVYGTIKTDSALLVAVPGSSAGPKRLHRCAAAGFAAMAEVVKRELGIELKAASAWRPHRWSSREQYESFVIAKYGDLRTGKVYLAFDSPHETGLAVDFGVGGLTPSRATIKAQSVAPLHLWLMKHASDYGWYPYKKEPWHWEFPLSREAYASGVIEADDPGPPEDDVSFGIDGEPDPDDLVIEDEYLEEFVDLATDP